MIAVFGQDTGQTGYVVTQLAFELDTVFGNRKAAEDLELGIRRVTPEDRTQAVGVTGLLPQLAKGCNQGVPVVTGLFQPHRVPEGFQQDDVNIAWGKDLGRGGVTAGMLQETARRCHGKVTVRRHPGVGKETGAFLQQIEQRTPTDVVGTLVPHRIAEMAIQRLQNRLGFDHQRHTEQQQQQTRRVGAPVTQADVEQQQHEDRRERHGGGKEVPAIQNQQQGVQREQIIGHDRSAEVG